MVGPAGKSRVSGEQEAGHSYPEADPSLARACARLAFFS